MTFARVIVSSNVAISSPARDAIVNTLYFNFTEVGDPNYSGFLNDFAAAWEMGIWASGRYMDYRIYDMGDDEPRPPKARVTRQVAGGVQGGPRQVALCLSYYADRNLPRQRGRIYLGPWTTGSASASTTQTQAVIDLAGRLAGLGGLNVDWSLWSPRTQQHTRINHAWVDDSWDIIRSRKIPAVADRKTWTGNG